MKENLKRLQTIKIELFYSVTISKRDICLQGKLTEESLAYSKELGIDNFENTQGMILSGQNGNLRIALTF